MSAARGLLLAGVLAFLIGLVPSAALAKDGTVVISAPGADNRSVTVRLASLGTPDVNNQAYSLPGGTQPRSGYSISRVLRAAETEASAWLDLETLPSVEVDRPTGGPVTLSRSQALGQGDRPPIFYENSGTTVFLLPGSPSREYVFRFTPVGIKVGSETLLDVSLSASPKKPRRGQSVTFTAEVGGAPSGARIRYRWSFSDGATETTTVPRVTHRFSGTGRRSVVLTVTAGDRQGQGALSLDVTGGGGGNGSPSPGGPPAAAPGGGGGTAGGFGSGFGGGSGGSSGSGQGSGAAGEPIPFEPEAAPSNDPSDGLEEVTGTVIDPQATASAAAPGPGGPNASASSGGDALGLPGEAVTLFGVGLLIALGGLIEARVLVRRP